jgi:hypothetical protein
MSKTKSMKFSTTLSIGTLSFDVVFWAYRGLHQKKYCGNRFSETPDFAIMTGFLLYLPISNTTKYKKRTCSLLQLLIG